MKIDRELQKTLLQNLKHSFPQAVDLDELRACVPAATVDPRDAHLVANLYYLSGHGLLRLHPPEDDDDELSVSATSRGIDFIEDDGGLTAILGVTTVRLHEDTLKSLVEDRILALPDLPPIDKQRWLSQLRSLPADATRHLVLKLVEKGLDSGPQAIESIGNILKAVAS